LCELADEAGGSVFVLAFIRYQHTARPRWCALIRALAMPKWVKL
jgi:hypothetical protein